MSERDHSRAYKFTYIYIRLVSHVVGETAAADLWNVTFISWRQSSLNNQLLEGIEARLGTSLEPKFWMHMVGSWFLRGCHGLRVGQMDRVSESVTDGKWADSRIVLKVSICCGIHLKLVSTTLFNSLPINVHSWLDSVSVASIVYFLPRIQKLRSFNCDNFCALSVYIFFCQHSL